MTIATIIGAASIGSMISFVPQAIQIVRSRDTNGLSRNGYLMTLAPFARCARRCPASS